MIEGKQRPLSFAQSSLRFVQKTFLERALSGLEIVKNTEEKEAGFLSLPAIIFFKE